MTAIDLLLIVLAVLAGHTIAVVLALAWLRESLVTAFWQSHQKFYAVSSEVRTQAAEDRKLLTAILTQLDPESMDGDS